MNRRGFLKALIGASIAAPLVVAKPKQPRLIKFMFTSLSEAHLVLSRFVANGYELWQSPDGRYALPVYDRSGRPTAQLFAAVIVPEAALADALDRAEEIGGTLSERHRHTLNRDLQQELRAALKAAREGGKW